MMTSGMTSGMTSDDKEHVINDLTMIESAHVCSGFA